MGSIIDAIGGLFGANSQAHNAQKGVSDFQNATNTANQIYSPFISGGTNAFNSAQAMLQPGYKYSSSDPAYAWNLSQGLEGNNNAAAAAGSLDSGGTRKSAMRFANGLAANDFNNAFNRQTGLANFGLQAANGDVNALLNGARGTAQYRGNQGDATAGEFGQGANLISSVGKFFGF